MKTDDGTRHSIWTATHKKRLVCIPMKIIIGRVMFTKNDKYYCVCDTSSDPILVWKVRKSVGFLIFFFQRMLVFWSASVWKDSYFQVFKDSLGRWNWIPSLPYKDWFFEYDADELSLFIIHYFMEIILNKLQEEKLSPKWRNLKKWEMINFNYSGKQDNWMRKKKILKRTVKRNNFFSLVFMKFSCPPIWFSNFPIFQP